MPSQHFLQLEASAAAKISQYAQDHYPKCSTGPILGFDHDDKTISISHVYQFPSNLSANQTKDPGYTLSFSTNIKYQRDIIAQLDELKVGAKFVGWWIASTGGKFVNSHMLESIIFQTRQKREEGDTCPVILLVHDPSKSCQGFLSLKALKLSEDFIKVFESRDKFTTNNLKAHNLSYNNIFEEIPLGINKSGLVNLVNLPLDAEYDVFKLSNNTKSVSTDLEQLSDEIEHFNHIQRGVHYYQRALEREEVKINQWKQKNADQDWSKHFQLPQEPSRLDNLVTSALINNHVQDLETEGDKELVKNFAVEKALEA